MFYFIYFLHFRGRKFQGKYKNIEKPQKFKNMSFVYYFLYLRGKKIQKNAKTIEKQNEFLGDKRENDMTSQRSIRTCFQNLCKSEK